MRVDRAQLRNLADGFAAVVAFVLPWSTSATLIAIALWLVTLVPTLRRDELRDVMRHPAAFIPVMLFVLAAVGTLWADVPWKERLGGLSPFARLLILPLLFVQFRNSDRWRWVFAAFLGSCTLLLALSFAGILNGGSFVIRFKTYGVPTRDYIAQAGAFTLCAAGLFYLAMREWSQRKMLVALGVLSLAVLFLLNVLYVAPSRTGLVTIPILLVLFAITQCRWKQMLALLAGIVVLAGAVWISSSKVQERITGIYTEIQNYRADNMETSAGIRVEFWQQSLKIVREAPLIGHGTGSVREMFARAFTAQGNTATKVPTVNPHNQIFMVAIQLGAIGALMLIAMWVAHFSLFVRGSGLAAWIGLAIVAQNMIGCLFNNHLFDSMQAWLYLFGVGAAGGAMLSHMRGAMNPALPSGKLAT